jgi:biopolymer transport protein ExbD
MVKIKKKSNKGAEIPTGSMADIAFLLLLFFLVATVIDVDTGIGLVLPEKIEDAPVVPLSKDRMAALLINENGDVLLDKNVIAIPQIRENLIERITSKIPLPSKSKLVVSVKTDRKTNYNLYIQALDQVNGAYAEVRDSYAMETYGKVLEDCNDDEARDVKEKIPKIISLAEPETVKK